MRWTPASRNGADDLARDVMRAFDEIRDDQNVADALAAVGAQVAVA
jgi:hypothetical protein